ncbi:MAG: hypothetical protein Q4B78_02605, partial [Bacillota bacterium]|nr:hypothetical protein [Bacillota bacterium]
MKKKLISYILSLAMAFTVVGGAGNTVAFANEEGDNLDSVNTTEAVETELEEDGTKTDVSEESTDAEAKAEADENTGMSSQSVEPEAVSQAMEGDGTEASPYLITSEEDFQAMEAEGKSYKLKNDITVKTPYANEFKGNFDGNGKTVTVEIADTVANVGLFRKVGESAVISNLTLVGSVSVTGNRSYIGALVGYVNGGSGTVLFENIKNNVTVNGYKSVGGIAGYVTNGKVYFKKCANVGNITGGNMQIGGIAGGLNSGEQYFSNCYNTGNITGFNYSGGIVGQATKSSANPTIENCYSVGEFKGTSSYSPTPGSIIGLMSTKGSIKNCYGLKDSVTPAPAAGKNGVIGTENSKDIQNVSAKTEDEMKSPEFAELLGDAFAYNAGGYPVFAGSASSEEPEPEPQPVEYNVTFDLAGGSLADQDSIEAVKVVENGKVNNPGDPTKEGNDF